MKTICSLRLVYCNPKPICNTSCNTKAIPSILINGFLFKLLPQGKVRAIKPKIRRDLDTNKLDVNSVLLPIQVYILRIFIFGKQDKTNSIPLSPNVLIEWFLSEVIRSFVRSTLYPLTNIWFKRKSLFYPQNSIIFVPRISLN